MVCLAELMDNHRKRFEAYRKLGFFPNSILDIGAYEGHWTKMIRKIYPTAMTTMIEANKDKKEILENIGNTYIAVLGEQEGKEIDYFRCKNGVPTGNGVYKENTPYTFEPEKRICTTLDTLFDEHDRFDLIKMDVQGAELDIIKGGLRTIKKAEALLLELQMSEYNIGAPMAQDVICYLAGRGFEFIDVFDLMYADTKLIQIDALFRNKNYES